MKVRVASRTCGLGQSCGKGREKRKSPDSRSPDRAGMNSARPLPAERIRRSWEVKELGEVASGEWRVTSRKKEKRQQVPRCAWNDNLRGVGALVMRWRKRKRKSRAEARPLEGLVGPRRKRVA